MMKKIYKKCLLLLITMSLVVIGDVQAAYNPYSSSGPYGTNCTWYAWQQAYEKAGVALPGWGNAKDWYIDAQNAGYSVGTTPQANSIIVWGGWTPYGHVGYVERVEGNTLYVWDSTGPCIDESDPAYIECMKNSMYEDTDRICKQNARKGACQYTISPDQYGITGYIYLNVAPQTTYTAPSTTPTVTEPEVVEVPKSNNTNLSSIELSDGTIEFNKDVLEYKIKVKNKVNKITVNALAEDEKATIDGIGEHDLKVGLNELKITVKAEDGSVKEYVLKVTREKKKVVKKEEKKEKTKENQTPIIYGIGGGIIVVVLITAGSILIYKKKKRKKSKSDKTEKEKIETQVIKESEKQSDTQKQTEQKKQD